MLLKHFYSGKDRTQLRIKTSVPISIKYIATSFKESNCLNHKIEVIYAFWWLFIIMAELNFTQLAYMQIGISNQLSSGALNFLFHQELMQAFTLIMEKVRHKLL